MGLWNSTDQKAHINLLEMKVVTSSAENLGLPSQRSHSCLARRQQACYGLPSQGRGDQVLESLHHHQGGVQGPRQVGHPTEASVHQGDAWGREVREWCLAPTMSGRLFKMWTRPNWDLFADKENALATNFFSLDSRDPTDAFLQSWSGLQGHLYTFPPPQLLAQVLAKVSQDKVSLTLIAPCWEEAAWLSELLDLSVKSPRKLPPEAVTEGMGAGRTQDGGLECFRRKVTQARTTPELATFLLSTFKPSSRKVYIRAWKAWAQWCNSRGVESANPTLTVLLVYLLFLL